MEIKYVKNGDLNAKELIEVFLNVGWNKNEEDIVEAFKKSYYILAYEEDQLVDFARAISDGFYYTGIYDVVVKTEYQKQGIGRYLVKALLEEFTDTYIFLTYTDGNHDFYANCGLLDNKQSMWIPK